MAESGIGDLVVGKVRIWSRVGGPQVNQRLVGDLVVEEIQRPELGQARQVS